MLALFFRLFMHKRSLYRGIRLLLGNKNFDWQSTFPPVFQLKIILFQFLLSLLEKSRGPRLLRWLMSQTGACLASHDPAEPVRRMVEQGRTCASGHRWPRPTTRPPAGHWTSHWRFGRVTAGRPCRELPEGDSSHLGRSLDSGSGSD